MISLTHFSQLIFHLFHQGKYIALFMEEGHVIFQFDLGSGGVTLRSENAYNDGQDHRVEVAREKNRGVLRVGWENRIYLHILFLTLYFLPQLFFS